MEQKTGQKERQAILLARQYLTVPSEPKTVIRDLCGLQAQYLKNVCHGLRIHRKSRTVCFWRALTR